MADGLLFEYEEIRIKRTKEKAKRTRARKAKLLRLIKLYRHENKTAAALVLKEIKKVLSTI